MKDIKYMLLLFCVFCSWSLILGTPDYTDEENMIDHAENSAYETAGAEIPKSSCWMTLNAPHLFKVMDDIDDRYQSVRTDIHEALMATDFDEDMIKGLVRSRGSALREVHVFKQRMIPSGLNLGGYCMLRMPESVLFFHRMKLRNNTYFRIESLHNDFANMQVRIDLCLNDLHLKGAYERSLTDDNPSVLFYAPTFGEVEFLLKNVRYKMEGRYRLIKYRLVIEMVSSEIIANDILMTYLNQGTSNSAERIEKDNLGSFMSRLKVDLDQWLKDYFNDYMIYIGLDGLSSISHFAKYDKEKATALEEYTDKAVNAIVTRIRLLNADTIRVPAFTFKSIHGVEIKLYDGYLRGLDSMYRRSVATGVKLKDIRKVDTVVGFSNLKVVYKYEAILPTGVPPLAGVLTLSANELSAHLALGLVKEPEAVDLDIEFLDQMKPESLTVEGAANTMIANFKHLLEHEIVAMMSNTLLHGIMMLKSLPSCEPFFAGQIPNKNKENNDDNLHPDYDYTHPNFYSDDHSVHDDVNPKEDNYEEYDGDVMLSYNEEEEPSRAKAVLRSTKKPINKFKNKQSKKKITKNNKPGVKKFRKLRNKRRNDKAKQKM